MIPRAYIDEWRAVAPWSTDAWVEQDLVISRALVELFRVNAIAQRLAFRGGTALYKLYLRPAARYSEDIDLVQVVPEAIGDTLDIVRSVLDPWLGQPKRTFKEGRVSLIYRFGTEGSPPIRMRLKIEINSREHFSEFGLVKVPFAVENRWFAGEAEVTTFTIDELLGTKLRALYQRKKGRDLFDLWHALDRGLVDEGALVRCFDRYMREGGHSVTRAQFEANLADKAGRREFRGDIGPLLRPGAGWDFDQAFELVSERLVALLPGRSWKGDG
ncbi:MAG: nucleotidyl transferase AbiEii/AbiGii toxin family protein [Myxococcales bacterium]|nr:nucleotidyl transferase AbiEii/AbiGii toxin family protein [Myxococcales bacterium]